MTEAERWDEVRHGPVQLSIPVGATRTYSGEPEVSQWIDGSLGLAITAFRRSTPLRGELGLTSAVDALQVARGAGRRVILERTASRFVAQVTFGALDASSARTIGLVLADGTIVVVDVVYPTALESELASLVDQVLASVQAQDPDPA